MKERKLGIIFTLIILSQTFLMVPSILVLGKIDTEELAEECILINANLQEEFFKKAVTGGLRGIGEDEGSRIYGDTFSYPLENVIALAAFYNRYVRSGVSLTESWAEEEIFTALQSLDAGDVIERENEESIYYTVDQGALLEFMGEAYQKSSNQKLLDYLEKIYNRLKDFESSSKNEELSGYDGAYWRAIEDDKEIGDPDKLIEVYLPEDSEYKYCFANASLWAVIGMLSFGLTVKDLTIDRENDYFDNSLERAKVVIEFLENRCFFNGSGFKEYPYAEMVNPTHQYYYFNTQVLALLAYTRLYEASKEQIYLDKAKVMVEYIITKNFADSGNNTGCVSWISNGMGTRSNTKLGYDNALYAYALIRLYEATEEQESLYLKRAEEIILFMNARLYQESEDGTIVGYVEYFVNGKIPADKDKGQYRLYKTNALMMHVNEDLVYHERPWYVKYMIWMIAGAIGVITLAGILILLRKRSRVGTKMPKITRGLLDDD